MKNTNAMSGGLIDPAKYAMLMRQYRRENPYDLSELCRKRRPRIVVKPASEMVFSTRALA